MKYIITLLLLLLILPGLIARSNPNIDLNEYTIVGFAQGTSYSIKYYAEKPILKNAIDSILNVIDLSMSIYRKDSAIAKFNNSKTRKIEMDSHMKAVIDESFHTYTLTKGYFDITVMPLVNLWGFGVKSESPMPTEEDVKKVKSLVGMKYLKQKRNFLIKNKKGISIDVNGIAQGYTVDVLGEYLSANHIDNYIIELGGEIIAKGQKPSGSFVVEIQRPYVGENHSTYKVKLNNKAITSSGSYERYRKLNSKQISHHIDPRTGYPIVSNLLSVTVIANTAMKADAIDNFLMALKPEEAILFIESQPDLECYIIFLENNIVKELASSGFNNYIYN